MFFVLFFSCANKIYNFIKYHQSQKSINSCFENVNNNPYCDEFFFQVSTPCKRQTVREMAVFLLVSLAEDLRFDF